MRKTKQNYCDLGEKCNGDDFITGQIVYYSEEENNYFCGACAVKLQRDYKLQFEDAVYTGD
ncbi:hypothetical protein [Peribacillus loiseleuriae]|uniref:Uncharacterized protein n=1 Tax=Peribacillus loiseleuriae TaxID=1679170 RepID=A0A0K9GSG2_9BACI|nr:hypothetical protein [Peribacillus loiseleuriae]KMY49578.1 hypothetical protein AC625_08495 [Peribacillus loiseleuriae]